MKLLSMTPNSESNITSLNPVKNSNLKQERLLKRH